MFENPHLGKPMPTTRKLNVFLCHASQDKPAVRKLYASLLKESWIEPWLGEEKLLSGMNGDMEIQKALSNTDLIIVCLSSESVSEEGYTQRKFKRVLSYAEEKPEGTIYFVVLRLNDCTPPIKFQQWQWVDYFAKNSDKRLLQWLRFRAEKLGINVDDSATVKPSLRSTPVSSGSQPEVFTQGGRPVYVFGGMDFVKVVGGEFYMGSDDIEAASPRHLIDQLSDDFYVGRYPVTNQDFAWFLRGIGQSVVMSKGREKFPVIGVTWFQARDYVTWLNQKHQGDLPRNCKFRLPSEAEWEKCAHGKESNIFPWGNKFDPRRCNVVETKVGMASLVGSFSPQGDCAYGAADMAGNVWEWTRSIGEKFSYPYRFDDGREDELGNDENKYILRGGSFKCNQGEVRCANRIYSEPSKKESDFGFRVAICPIK
jgi:toxoflavin biosynthesis protein ToxD